MIRITRLDGLLLDWDGTLLDSFHAQVAATRVALAAHGGEWSLELFLAYPTDWRAHYRAAGIPEARLADASATYRSVYAQEQTKLRPYVRRTLTRLANAGVALAIVTSGTRHRVMQELARHRLTDFFAVVITFDDVAEPKPSPDGLEHAISKLEMTSARTASVGDTVADQLAAEAAGVRHIMIRSPYTSHAHRHEAIGSWRVLERQFFADAQW